MLLEKTKSIKMLHKIHFHNAINSFNDFLIQSKY